MVPRILSFKCLDSRKVNKQILQTHYNKINQSGRLTIYCFFYFLFRNICSECNKIVVKSSSLKCAVCTATLIITGTQCNLVKFMLYPVLPSLGYQTNFRGRVIYFLAIP